MNNGTVMAGTAAVVEGTTNPASSGGITDGESLMRSTCQCPAATDISSGKSIGSNTPDAVCKTARTVT